MKKFFIFSILCMSKSKISYASAPYDIFWSHFSPLVREGFLEKRYGVNVVFYADFTNLEEKDFVIGKVSAYLLWADRFSKRYGKPTCEQKETVLHIYYVPREIINDRDIMHFLSWSKWNNKNIYGAFDSTYSPKGTATIFLSSTHSRKDVDETIKHEIYHYWQYRICQVLEETSAYQFETYHVVK